MEQDFCTRFAKAGGGNSTFVTENEVNMKGKIVNALQSCFEIGHLNAKVAYNNQESAIFTPTKEKFIRE